VIIVGNSSWVDVEDGVVQAAFGFAFGDLEKVARLEFGGFVDFEREFLSSANGNSGVGVMLGVVDEFDYTQGVVDFPIEGLGWMVGRCLAVGLTFLGKGLGSFICSVGMVLLFIYSQTAPLWKVLLGVYKPEIIRVSVNSVLFLVALD
jgi:hypothetical protein